MDLYVRKSEIKKLNFMKKKSGAECIDRYMDLYVRKSEIKKLNFIK